MQFNNNAFPDYILVEDQYIFYYANFPEMLKSENTFKTKTCSNDESKQVYLLFEDIAYEGIYVDDKGCLCYVIPFCKHCNSLNVVRKDFNIRELYLSNGNVLNVRMKRYLCNDCGHKSQTELFGLYEPYARISTPVLGLAKQALGNGYKSLRQQSDDLKLYCGVEISYESIRKSLLVDGEYYYKNNLVELSGFCSYDAQWIPIEGKFYFRLVLFDIVENMPISESIVEKENNETIYEFINRSIPTHKRTAIITDSKNGYNTVMRKLGFKHHQHCIFHLLQRIVDKIRKKIKNTLHEYEIEIKKDTSKISGSKINKLLNNKSKELWKHYRVYLDEFKSIFKQKTRNDAVTKINEIKSKISSYPDFIANYLKNNFFPEYAKYIVFLKDSVKKYLEATNNKVENYIGNILSKPKKKIFRTIHGVFSHIFHRKDGWISKRLAEKEKNKNPI